MCIICNCLNHEDDADAFLAHFAQASHAMREATDAMLKVSKVCAPEFRAKYDAIHKQMVTQVRDWNRLEQQRESH